MEELARDLGFYKRSGEAVVLFAGERAERLAQQLTELGAETAWAPSLARRPVPGEALAVAEALPRGFAYPELHLTVLGAQELFGKEARPAGRRGRARGALRLPELAAGDFVVHEAYGIGRFVGVETLTVQGHTRDYLLLEYRGGDRLYIPTDQLDRVQKYIGAGEDAAPGLSRLGGGEWQSRVNRARESAKKLAVDLAALYAGRMNGRGFAFSKDTPWQAQMEARFPYRETPDQLACIREIKADMERPRPMDRLLCGDVGYGKTEVALRAAFKAVQDSKQVAFLVPTTLLAQQHYNTMRARFADFPVRTACLSRFTPAGERRAVCEQLRAGRIDVIVGTHALLGKEVRFKDLGLLIIDEEQRFGVNHKEQIKALKADVDVLTLTATPIPRTLHMSMTGIRDISVLETPPESRYPVQTFVLEYSDALVTEALSRELARGGQAYVVCNRVQGMEAQLRRLRELVPEARVAMAHGQMPEGALERTMLAFLEREYDVLLCSSIIESGLDIPNVNTLLVLDADRFGLAQLYQLRGRVGRSTRLGYAYFTVRRGAAMSEQAHRRLMAIREFTQFGRGVPPGHARPGDPRRGEPARGRAARAHRGRGVRILLQAHARRGGRGARRGRARGGGGRGRGRAGFGAHPARVRAGRGAAPRGLPPHRGRGGRGRAARRARGARGPLRRAARAGGEPAAALPPAPRRRAGAARRRIRAPGRGAAHLPRGRAARRGAPARRRFRRARRAAHRHGAPRHPPAAAGRRAGNIFARAATISLHNRVLF